MPPSASWDLARRLPTRHPPQGISDKRLRAYIALQAAQGMEYLHLHYMVHFDLKVGGHAIAPCLTQLGACMRSGSRGPAAAPCARAAADGPV